MPIHRTKGCNVTQPARYNADDLSTPQLCTPVLFPIKFGGRDSILCATCLKQTVPSDLEEGDVGGRWQYLWMWRARRGGSYGRANGADGACNGAVSSVVDTDGG
jgi:hypothetical protein